MWAMTKSTLLKNRLELFYSRLWRDNKSKKNEIVVFPVVKVVSQGVVWLCEFGFTAKRIWQIFQNYFENNGNGKWLLKSLPSLFVIILLIFAKQKYLKDNLGPSPNFLEKIFFLLVYSWKIAYLGKWKTSLTFWPSCISFIFAWNDRFERNHGKDIFAINLVGSFLLQIRIGHFLQSPFWPLFDISAFQDIQFLESWL